MSDTASHHSDSSFDEADDQDWADWVDDDEGTGGQTMQYGTDGAEGSSASKGFKVPTQALFPGSDGRYITFDSPVEALEHAKQAQSCDLVAVVKRASLDTLQAIRLINHIRRQASQGNALSGSAINGLTGKEPLFSDDAELIPVKGFENDGLLQLDFDEFEDPAELPGASSSSSKARISELESELLAMRLAFTELRDSYSTRIGLQQQGQETAGPSSSSSSTQAANAEAPVDIDSHYFSSYAQNDIHQTMIEDSIRTLSYAKFLLSPRNASLIRGKTVMDVGCGSGILSLFCARAGAKKVLAIDASEVAHRARANVEANGWDHVVEVHKGKVEDLQPQLSQYEGKVDLIVSEWMGYFLLYECMLPAVLVARDRYLNKDTGLLAPSHCRMLLSAVSDEPLLHQRINFWDNVYGFTMPAMRKGLEDEAYTETVDSMDKVVTSTVPIYDLPLQTMRAAQPSFISPFVLECTSNKPTTIHGFLSWFDTWFVPREQHPPLSSSSIHQLQGGETIDGLPPCTSHPIQASDVEGIQLSGNGTQNPAAATQRPATSEEAAAGPETVSFTTGPHGKETHWRQTVFLLKEPIIVSDPQDTVLVGEIHVRPCKGGQARELDVEIHWCVRSKKEHEDKVDADGDAEMGGEGAGKKNKKKVEARSVQIWSVR